MKKLAITSTIAAATLFATPAFAQEKSDATVYIGANIGIHDLGAPNDLGVDIDDNGFIYGGYIGVDVPVGDILIIGAEGNFNLGTSAIDSDYGVTAKLGVQFGNGGQLFLRGGYQEINLDISNFSNGLLTDADFPDDTSGDYLVGVGAQFGLNEKVAIRAVFDTVAFDSTRATIGLQFNF